MASQHETVNKRPKWNKNTTRMSWQDADSALLKLALVAVTTNGGCIQFNSTRDGGQLILKVWQGMNTIEEYCGNPQDLDSLLEWVASTCA